MLRKSTIFALHAVLVITGPVGFATAAEQGVYAARSEGQLITFDQIDLMGRRMLTASAAFPRPDWRRGDWPRLPGAPRPLPLCGLFSPRSPEPVAGGHAVQLLEAARESAAGTPRPIFVADPSAAEESPAVAVSAAADSMATFALNNSAFWSAKIAGSP